MASTFKQRVKRKLHFHHNTLELCSSPDLPHILPLSLPEGVLLSAKLLRESHASSLQAEATLFISPADNEPIWKMPLQR